MLSPHMIGSGKPTIPFLKWAGGKRWLTQRALDFIPTSYDRYVEPFLGGGALYFALKPPAALLSDLNPQLIETYRAIQLDWTAVVKKLKWHQSQHSKKHYYTERSRKRRNLYSRAAQFIYLNRTCWNGLYRVNLAGQFNVPIGTKNSVLLDTDDFEQVALQLQTSKLETADFESVLTNCAKGDFVFIDPPYTVKHNLNGFVKYNEKLFSWNDQLRLREAVEAAVSRGARILMTNANHPSIIELYSDIGEIEVAARASVLAANSEFRVPTSELLISA